MQLVYSNIIIICLRMDEGSVSETIQVHLIFVTKIPLLVWSTDLQREGGGEREKGRKGGRVRDRDRQTDRQREK